MFYLIDIGFGLGAFIFIFLGIKRGFIGEIVRLIALIGGFLVALSLAPQFSRYFLTLHIAYPFAYSIAFFLIYVVFAIAILLIGWIIKKIVHLVLLGWLDKLLGMICGLIKALFIGWVIVLISTLMADTQTQRKLLRSPTYHMLARYQPKRLPLVSSVQKAIDALKSHDPFGQLQKTEAQLKASQPIIAPAPKNPQTKK